MPLINFGYGDLCSLLGEKVPKDVLMERIPMIGADMHDGDTASDEMSVEFFPDRPDLFCVEGMARALRNFLGISGCVPTYDVAESGMRLDVEKSVADVRPYIMCAVVRGLDIDDAVLKSIMDMQEKLHITIGRKRSKLAIGIHDLSKIKPPFTYKAVAPTSLRFVPLAFEEEMDLAEVLKKHPKGIEYGNILKGAKKYPIILDADGNVLSFPPIINGNLTAVKVGKRDLFVDVTGTDVRAVKNALDLVVTALAERGGKIFSVEISDGKNVHSYPNLSPTVWKMSAADCRRHLGADISDEEMCVALGRMGFSSTVSGDAINVDVPAVRTDIMHKVDLYEDVAIGHGYERFGGKHPVTQTYGSLMRSTVASEKVRDFAVGLGYMEVVTLTLSSERDEFELPRIPETEAVKVLNPISEDHTCLRASLFPSLMRVFRKNKHRDLPQRIFEVGDVVIDARRRKKLCMAEMDSKSSFTGIKSVAESILGDMGAQYVLEESQMGTFIPGRGAEILCSGVSVGRFGEVSPSVLEAFEITHPMAFLELDLDAVLSGDARIM